MGTQRPELVSTKLQRIATMARESPLLAFTSIHHLIDLELLREAWRRTRKDGATGTDGVTAQEYAEHLETNLQQLLDRFRSDQYRAPPVRRVHIPKGDGSKTRPIGIPTLEDKVLQRAVAMVLEAIYEQDFLNCSYGFRPGRSAHQALSALREGLWERRGGWVLELDIRAFFDTLVHGHLRSFLDERVRDGVLRRTIDRWLKAGVLEDGRVTRTEEGTPQGGVISPLLANLYLHKVLDEWFERDIKPRLSGQASLIRYADDAVLVFSREDDARRVLAVLPKRFGRYGLTLHPEKTRLLGFWRPPRHTGHAGPAEATRSGAFDFLGFMHSWGLSRNSFWIIKRKTARSRLRRVLKRISEWCQIHRHDALADQQVGLSAILRGHFAYFGITGNSRGLGLVRHVTCWLWRKWLARRSQKHQLGWQQFR